MTMSTGGKIAIGLGLTGLAGAIVALLMSGKSEASDDTIITGNGSNNGNGEKPTEPQIPGEVGEWVPVRPQVPANNEIDRRFNKSLGDFTDSGVGDRLTIRGGGGDWHWASKSESWWKWFDRTTSDRNFNIINNSKDHFMVVERWNEDAFETMRAGESYIQNQANYDFTYIIPPLGSYGESRKEVPLSNNVPMKISRSIGGGGKGLNNNVILAFIKVVHKNARWDRLRAQTRKRITESDLRYGTNYESGFKSESQWGDNQVLYGIDTDKPDFIWVPGG